MMTFLEYLDHFQGRYAPKEVKDTYNALYAWFSGIFVQGRSPGKLRNVRKAFKVVEKEFPTKVPSAAYRFTIIPSTEGKGLEGRSVIYNPQSDIQSWSLSKAAAEEYRDEIGSTLNVRSQKNVEFTNAYAMIEIKPTRMMVVGSIGSAIKWAQKHTSPTMAYWMTEWEDQEEIVLDVNRGTRVKVIKVTDWW